MATAVRWHGEAEPTPELALSGTVSAREWRGPSHSAGSASSSTNTAIGSCGGCSLVLPLMG